MKTVAARATAVDAHVVGDELPLQVGPPYAPQPAGLVEAVLTVVGTDPATATAPDPLRGPGTGALRTDPPSLP